MSFGVFAFLDSGRNFMNCKRLLSLCLRNDRWFVLSFYEAVKYIKVKFVAVSKTG